MPLTLLDEPAPECASCGWGSRQTERCTLCRCEDAAPTALARVVLPALDELMQRRAGKRTVVAAISESVDAAFTDLEWNAYDVVQRVGCLAMFVSLGSLAALSRVL
ncbi:MAG: hypothetical protein EPO32_14780 [Anaerolineae bacterium]|nr:MAG: hypothetical protein EPO32_14780 [Anaerolineae bacterium]